MIDFERHPNNVPGRWFVETTCLNCATCFELAPELFRNEFRQGVGGQTVVRKQPITPEEEALMSRARDMCCVEAIHESCDNHTRDAA